MRQEPRRVEPAALGGSGGTPLKISRCCTRGGLGFVFFVVGRLAAHARVPRWAGLCVHTRKLRDGGLPRCGVVVDSHEGTS